MNFRDKVLYHQIHPLKLGTDILASLGVTLFLLAAQTSYWPSPAFIASVHCVTCRHLHGRSRDTKTIYVWSIPETNDNPQN